MRDDAPRDHPRPAPAGLRLGRLSRWPKRPRRASSSGSIPRRRGILPLDGLHVSRRLARELPRAATSRSGWTATSPAWSPPAPSGPRPGSTPRSGGSTATCTGWATRIRSRSGTTGALAGGLYGVALGAAFFGESMFSRRRDASKLALIALVARLRAGGFRLLDTQFVTAHLARLGAVEISRAAYHRALEAAVNRPADFLALPADASRRQLLGLPLGPAAAVLPARRTGSHTGCASLCIMGASKVSPLP